MPEFYDIIIYPDGSKHYFPQGVDEVLKTKEQLFPLASKLLKENGERYIYYHWEERANA